MLPTQDDYEDERLDTEAPLTQRGLISSNDRTNEDLTPGREDWLEPSDSFSASGKKHRKGTEIPSVPLGARASADIDNSSQVKLDDDDELGEAESANLHTERALISDGGGTDNEFDPPIIYSAGRQGSD